MVTEGVYHVEGYVVGVGMQGDTGIVGSFIIYV